jgi:glutamate-5-semialdehyde dehydrogenase
MTSQQDDGGSNERMFAKAAKKASLVVGALSLSERNSALQTIYDSLQKHKAEVLAANQRDMTVAETLVGKGELQRSMVKRLDLSLPGKYDSMCQGVLDIIALEDPLGRITYATKMDEGLYLRRVTCALGVLLVIFEARPEVVVNITALTLKSGIHTHLLRLSADEQATPQSSKAERNPFILPPY